ncbi:hypothetical protein GGR56DRAFT_182997 [Xylariaceae sp. FL0804]|nr:hypothetical protein GGR56DRAFT_182997 [Xylariaceae sp. FL0804]
MKAAVLLVDQPRVAEVVMSSTENQVPLTFIRWLSKEFTESRISLERLRTPFLFTVQTQTIFFQRCQAVRALYGPEKPSEDLVPMVSDAVEIVLRDCDAQIQNFTEGATLLDFALEHRGYDYVKTEVFPLVQQRFGRTDFALEFLAALLKAIRQRTIRQDGAMLDYARLAGNAIRKLPVKSLVVYGAPSPGPARMTPPALRRDRYPDRSPGGVEYRLVLGFVTSLFEASFWLSDQLDLLVKKIMVEWLALPEESFQKLWIPLLKDILLMLPRYNIPLSSPRWTRLYQRILKRYVAFCVGRRPVHSLVMDPMPCECAECGALNGFLQDPSQRYIHRMLSKAQWEHVIKQLPMMVRCSARWTGKWDDTNPQSVEFSKKRAADMRYDERLRAWRERRAEAKRHLDAFDQQKLRAVLGDKAEDIIDMAILERPPPPASAATGGRAGPPGSPPTSGSPQQAQPAGADEEQEVARPDGARRASDPPAAKARRTGFSLRVPVSPTIPATPMSQPDHARPARTRSRRIGSNLRVPAPRPPTPERPPPPPAQPVSFSFPPGSSSAWGSSAGAVRPGPTTTTTTAPHAAASSSTTNSTTNSTTTSTASSDSEGPALAPAPAPAPSTWQVVHPSCALWPARHGAWVAAPAPAQQSYPAVAATTSSTSTTPTASPTPSPPLVAGAKRKLEEIADLVGDD